MGDMKSLEKMKSQKVNLDSCDYDFRTALHLASAVGDEKAVNWLLSNGAKITVDRFGGLPIHDALRNNHSKIAALL
jgi:ankyrin repeat protein